MTNDAALFLLLGVVVVALVAFAAIALHRARRRRSTTITVGSDLIAPGDLIVVSGRLHRVTACDPDTCTVTIIP